MNPSIGSHDPTLPAPPFSAELLAEYDAQALGPDVSKHITDHLGQDPQARRILAALAATRAEIAGAAVEPSEVPPAVAERLAHLIDHRGNISP